MKQEVKCGVEDAVGHANNVLSVLGRNSEFCMTEETYNTFCKHIEAINQVGNNQDNASYYALLLAMLARSTHQQNIKVSDALCSYFVRLNPVVGGAIDAGFEKKAAEKKTVELKPQLGPSSA